jgi:prepilin-type N-terminal cleavage/methylation domain-containing protein/prepilin-type processing-associated H-X9-DG protein
LRASASIHRGRAANRGFTLVELMVTVSIIALLMGLLIPAMGAVRRASLETRCRSNLRQMACALHSYLNVSDEHYPLSSHSTGSVTDPSAWLQSLVSHGFAGEVRWCPADPFAEKRTTSFATNTYFEPLVPGIDFDPFTHATLPGGRTSAVSRLVQVKSPERTLWAVETPGTGLVDHLHAVGWTSTDQIRASMAVERHGDGSNALFADGHDASVTWLRLSTDFTDGHDPFNPDTPY